MSEPACDRPVWSSASGLGRAGGIVQRLRGPSAVMDKRREIDAAWAAAGLCAHHRRLASGAGPPSHPSARRLVGLHGHASCCIPAHTARTCSSRALHHVRRPPRVGTLARAGRLARAVSSWPSSRASCAELAIARGWSPTRPFCSRRAIRGLVARSAARLAEQLTALHASGRSLVLVTHDLKRAAELSDRAIVLSAGRIVFDSQGQPAAAETLERALLAASDSAA